MGQLTNSGAVDLEVAVLDHLVVAAGEQVDVDDATLASRVWPPPWLINGACDPNCVPPWTRAEAPTPVETTPESGQE
jgi:hypothetical protein